jgi:hypothetical protein
MHTACIFAEVEKGQALKVKERLSELKSVGMVLLAAGPFDVIIFIRSESPESFAVTIVNEIHAIPGIKTTLSNIILMGLTPIHWMKEQMVDQYAVEFGVSSSSTAPGEQVNSA